MYSHLYSFSFKHQVSTSKDDNEAVNQGTDNNIIAASATTNENQESNNPSKAAAAATVTCLECMGAIKHRMMVQNTSLEVEADLRRSIKVLDKFRNSNKKYVYSYI